MKNEKFCVSGNHMRSYNKVSCKLERANSHKDRINKFFVIFQKKNKIQHENKSIRKKSINNFSFLNKSRKSILNSSKILGNFVKSFLEDENNRNIDKIHQKMKKYFSIRNENNNDKRDLIIKSNRTNLIERIASKSIKNSFHNRIASLRFNNFLLKKNKNLLKASIINLIKNILCDNNTKIENNGNLEKQTKCLNEFSSEYKNK